MAEIRVSVVDGIWDFLVLLYIYIKNLFVFYISVLDFEKIG